MINSIEIWGYLIYKIHSFEKLASFFFIDFLWARSTIEFQSFYLGFLKAKPQLLKFSSPNFTPFELSNRGAITVFVEWCLHLDFTLYAFCLDVL